MARPIRKVRAPLILNGVEVRDLESLRENFNVAVLADYAFDGRLVKWLRERYYEDEAEKVEALKPNDSDLENKLYEIFNVEKPLDAEEIAWRNERLARLKTFTNDKNILAKVDNVAFNQEDLSDLLDADISEIYLCDGRFTIPLKVKNKKYIGIKNAVAVIRSNAPVDFDALNISFENVKFNAEYEKIVHEKIFEDGKGEIEFDNFDDAKNFLEKAGVAFLDGAGFNGTNFGNNPNLKISFGDDAIKNLTPEEAKQFREKGFIINERVEPQGKVKVVVGEEEIKKYTKKSQNPFDDFFNNIW